MGKIIKFDPDRRRKPGKRSWTRPEDYGATRQRKPAPQPQQRRYVAPQGPSPRANMLAKLSVAAIIAAGVAVSLFGLT